MTLSCNTPLWRKIEVVAAQRQSERQAQEIARQAQEQREHEVTKRKQRVPKIPRDRILGEVAAKHNVSEDRLRCARRFKSLTRARFEAMYRLRAELGLSFLRIGAIFNRDHTTIMHGVRRYAEINGLPKP